MQPVDQLKAGKRKSKNAMLYYCVAAAARRWRLRACGINPRSSKAAIHDHDEARTIFQTAPVADLMQHKTTTVM